LLVAFGGGNRSGPIDQAATLTAKGQRVDFEVETFIAHALRAEGFDASEDGTGRGTPIVPVHAFDARQSDVIQYGDKTGPLDTDGYTMAVAFSIHSDAINRTGDALTPSPDAEGRVRLRPPGVGVAEDVSFAPTTLNPHAVAFQTHGSNIEVGSDISGTLQTNSDRASGSAPMVAQASSEPWTLAIRGRGDDSNFEYRQDGTANALLTPNGGRAGMGVAAIATQWAVRRLTPRECERLQGVPDDYTKIPWRGKPASECPDGPRYKALGNSWAVPVVRWIGERIDADL
jgi:DNA (cytosine-5)-methyltransferase 1